MNIFNLTPVLRWAMLQSHLERWRLRRNIRISRTLDLNEFQIAEEETVNIPVDSNVY